jgi:N-methylhydantoinase A
VDTGGTFTDFVALVGSRLVTLKLPSTPRAPERAVLDGLERLGAGAGSRVRHGSTVATNTLLERKGARVVFATNAGFEDLIEIGRQDRPDLYALAPRRPEPLVPAERRVGVPQRNGPRGERWRPHTVADARRLTRRVAALEPEAIAIGLLHSYAHDLAEVMLGVGLKRRCRGVPVTLSSQLCPEVREFERFATTVANAYLMPRVSTYLRALAAGTAADLEIVLSHGGAAPPRLAALEPVRQLLSGPAAGLEAAAHVARACGMSPALTLDVGGTSTDCAFVAGDLPRRRAREVAGVPVLLPVLDVHTVGAGGGSIARVDAGGLLQVGPESAGAVPGPACYGHGGPSTVTDALVVLGRIPGEALAGGSFPLDRDAALEAMHRLGDRLGGRDALAAAEAVLAVADARIEAALRKVSVEQGHDPRGAALVAFGGAGGLHACAVAEALGARAVLFPRHAGVLSALGALAGASRREASRSVLLESHATAALERAWRDLEAEVRRQFAAVPGSSRGAPPVRLERWAEVRYRGQSHEVPLRVPAGAFGALAARFHREHERRFGFAEPDRPVEIVTVEVRGAAPDHWKEVAAAMGPPRGARPAGSGGWSARARVRHGGRWLTAAVWSRAALPARVALRGPAIVVEDGATLWIAPGWAATMHASGTLMLERGRQ